MRSRIAAALARFAAICGLLVAPSAATAQLRCANTPSDTLIRRVAFEGNETFTDEELSFHVVATPTDWTRRYLNNSKAVIGVGAGLGILAGAITSETNKIQNAALFGAAGLGVGYGMSKISGVPRCLRPGTLAGDIALLSGFYRDQGFSDVRVDTVTSVDGNWVDVTLRVTEGRPVLVDSFSIVGYDTTTLGALPTTLNSRVGGRYSPTLTQEDVDTLETRLRDHGYPEGFVERRVDFATESKYRASVRFAVTPGIRAAIGEIRIDQQTIDGRRRMIDTMAIRNILRFREGDLYSAIALNQAERRLYAARTFLSVEVAPDLRRLRSDSVVDVIVNVTEDLMHTSSVEPAVGTLDCVRLRGSYTDKAFLSGINRFEATGSVSKIGLAPQTQWGGLRNFCSWLAGVPDTALDPSIRNVNYDLTLRVTRPLPLRGGLLPSLSLYTRRSGGYQAYLRTTKIGGAVSVRKSITRTVVFEGSYNLEYGNTDASSTVLCFLFRACDSQARDQLTGKDKRLATLGASFLRDRRNNPDSSSAGSFVRLDLRAASRAFLSDSTLEFQKAVVDAAWYTRIGPGVLALRARTGSIWGGQPTASGVRLAPPQERLYVGGESSVRGFKQNELGPIIYVTSEPLTRVQQLLGGASSLADTARILRDSLDKRIIPAGGNAMYIGNVEYRLPGPFLPTLHTVLFLDFGALSTNGITTITGSNQFRFTPGIAFKYFSPVGPIQINIGYNQYSLQDGPVYSDQFPDTTPGRGNQRVLQCISGETLLSGGGRVCNPSANIRPLRNSFLNRLTLTVAFPPDF